MSGLRIAVATLAHDDGHRLHRLAQALSDVTPMIELLDDRALLVPMRGPTRYFGGEHEVAAQIVRVAHDIGVNDVSIGVGSSRLAARMAAAGGGVRIIPEKEHHSFIGSLPVAVLEDCGHIDPDVVSLFSRLGLGTLGAVARVGRGMLADRFGPAGNDAYVLCSGDDLHTVPAEALPTQCFVESHFDSPLGDVSAVVAVASEMAIRVVCELEPRGLVACRVIATFVTEHDETCSRVWYHPHGFTESMLVERLGRQIEKWLDEDLTAGVVHASLDVQTTETRRARQLGLWGENAEADRAARAAISRLVTIVGDAVGVPEWRGGRDPMRQFVLVPASRIDTWDSSVARQRVTPGGAHPREWTGSLGGIVPTVPVNPRRRVDVLDAAGNTVVVTGRHLFSSSPLCVVDGALRHRIIECCGPWPVEERWWDAARRRRVARVQFVVEVATRMRRGNARQAWLLVREAGSWWLVGVYG